MSVNAKVYTKTGDRGTTSLKGSMNVSKADDRIELIGSLEELSSHIGMVKVHAPASNRAELETIQKNLATMMEGVRDSFNEKARLSAEAVSGLEHRIDEIAAHVPDEEVVYPGENQSAALYEVARTITRKAERRMTALATHYAIPVVHKEYMNRLSDYFYMCARQAASEETKTGVEPKSIEKSTTEKSMTEESITEKSITEQSIREKSIIEQVIRNIQGPGRLNLDQAKRLIEKVEAFSRSKGLNSVISVCGPDGNMIAVHAMDDAFLASFDISMKKAYTSVAVKMSTMELSKLAQPGQTFYGVENTDGGRIVIFGGGVPLIYQGKIVGGLGVSGGTGEQDHEAASYGCSLLESILREV